MLLSKDEIKTFCEACLLRYIKKDDIIFFQTMVDYFTKLIFESLCTAQNKQIPLEDIRQYILQNKENSHLLIMFCGADF